jgi:hypothetical protein
MAPSSTKRLVLCSRAISPNPWEFDFVAFYAVVTNMAAPDMMGDIVAAGLLTFTR